MEPRQTNNNYNNVIAPSDGVRRFLCRNTMLLMSVITLVYCIFAYRMNAFEHAHFGGFLRSSMLYAAYLMLPAGLLTAAIFARVKSMGLAFSMISLLAAVPGALMLFLNAIASLLREKRMQGIAGSVLELLFFGALLAVCVNLLLSCMDFKIRPVLGTVGAVAAVAAVVITAARVATSFSALQFVWNSEFDWNQMAAQVRTDNLEYQYRWIFRSVAMTDASGMKQMFGLRLYERVAACAFYGLSIVWFIKYQNEMRAFNKLIAHASEYVEIPTARIVRSIGTKETAAGEPQRSEKGSVQRRLRELMNLTKAKEQGMDITQMAESSSFDGADEDDGEERPVRRRRHAAEYDEEYGEERPMRRRRPAAEYDEEYGEERPMRRRRPAADNYEEYGEERPVRRRRPAAENDEEYGEGRPMRRRRPAADNYEEYGEERPMRRRRHAAEYDEEYGEERPMRRRRPTADNYEEYGEERPMRRRRPAAENDEEYREGRPMRRRRSAAGNDYEDDGEQELTEEEKYLMEERRRRHPNESRERRPKRPSLDEEPNYRKQRRERVRTNDNDLQKNLNEYYNNYMQIREERTKTNHSKSDL